jgi:hypothetical protein
MKLPSRVFGLALLAGLAASALLLLLLQVVTEKSWQGAIRALLHPQGVLSFGIILVAAVLPASLPMTLVGACIATRMVSTQRYSRSIWFWISFGIAAGLLLGALGSALWFGGGNAIDIWNASWNAPPAGQIGISRQELLRLVWEMALLGGLSGALVGGVVGVFCWRSTRKLPPNQPLNPAGATIAPAG